MNGTNNEFSTILKNKLKEKRISQSELARRIDVTDTSISRYINGTAKPRPILLERIATVLNCSITDFK